MKDQQEEEMKAAEAAEEERKAAEAKAAEEKPPEDGEGEGEEEGEKKEEPKEKVLRPPTDKQEAYLEFKTTEGKKLEDSILMSRNDMREKRTASKNLTIHINNVKRSIDTLTAKLEKKEEERKMQSKAMRNEMGYDFDDEVA